MKVGLIGAGKRMLGTYVPALRFVGHDIIGFTTRTKETADKFSALTGVEPCSFDELFKLRPDYVLVCVTPTAVSSLVRAAFQYKIPILTETPILDLELLNAANAAGCTVGVLEQWPFLPLEQFKELVYRKGLISRPYLVKNDCRSYDYHALAQLRTYIGKNERPTTVQCVQVSRKLPEFESNEGDIKVLNDSWDLAHVTFESGAVLNHDFSYACKVAPFRSIQALRAYSNNGSIITGKIFDRSNDYEVIDIEFLDGRTTKRLEVNLTKNDNGAVTAITSDRIIWSTPIKEAIDDSMIAICQHLLNMDLVVNKNQQLLYNLKDASIDQYLMHAIKHAGMQKQIIKLT